MTTKFQSDNKTPILWESLSQRHSAFSYYGLRRRPTHAEKSCEYIE